MSNPLEAWVAAVTLKMESIKQENGYVNNIGTVFRVDILPDQMNATDFPAGFVLDPLGGGVLTADGKELYTYRYPLVIGGIVSVGGADIRSRERSKQLNYLKNDIWRALLQDAQFGGTCKDSVMVDGPAIVDVERGHGIYNCQLIGHLKFQRSDL